MKKEHREIKDMVGNVLKKKDFICFDLTRNIHDKEIVRATIAGFQYGKNPIEPIDYCIIGNYTDTGHVRASRLDNKLLKKVWCGRVIKCY